MNMNIDTDNIESCVLTNALIELDLSPTRDVSPPSITALTDSIAECSISKRKAKKCKPTFIKVPVKTFRYLKRKSCPDDYLPRNKRLVTQRYLARKAIELENYKTRLVKKESFREGK